tara:strand:- start:1682 stop:2008 length:327 start_codon:yes stop_codon:yes gene_type:complete
MKTYTINGKEYSEFAINKWCAELRDLKDVHENNGRVFFTSTEMQSKRAFEPCTDPSDTWPIIEKYWDELMEIWMNEDGTTYTTWDYAIEKHNCTKLVAACICFIEVNS